MPGLMIGISPKGGGGGSRSMPPPPDDDPMGGPPSQKDPAADKGGAKGELEKAGVVRASDHCSNCENYQTDGSCSKLPGHFDPDDACVKYFKEQAGGAGEPDEDDGPMPPPDDSAPAGPPMMGGQ